MSGETSKVTDVPAVQTLDEQHRILLATLHERRKYTCGICHNIFIRTDWDDILEIDKFPKVSTDVAGNNVLACKSCWYESIGEHLLDDMPGPMI